MTLIGRPDPAGGVRDVVRARSVQSPAMHFAHVLVPWQSVPGPRTPLPSLSPSPLSALTDWAGPRQSPGPGDGLNASPPPRRGALPPLQGGGAGWSAMSLEPRAGPGEGSRRRPAGSGGSRSCRPGCVSLLRGPPPIRAGPARPTAAGRYPAPRSRPLREPCRAPLENGGFVTPPDEGFFSLRFRCLPDWQENATLGK